MSNTKNLIPKGLYGYTVPTKTWSDIGDVLNKGAEFILKGLEPIGKVFTSFASAPLHGATSYATTGQFKTKERAKLRNLENKAFEEKVGPALSPSNHVVAWTQGSFDPRVGQQKIAEWGPLAQLASVGADIAAFKYVPKGVSAATRTGKNYLVAKLMDNILNKGTSPKVVLDISDKYAIDRGTTSSMIKSDGYQRKFWRKNRWVKEGNGFLDARFRPDEFEDPNVIKLGLPEAPEIPNKTYFIGHEQLPFKGIMGNGLGDNLNTTLTPNLQYNAFRYLHWTEPLVLKLGQYYLTTGDLLPILNYYKKATPLEKQQLSSITRQSLYLNSDIPYRYYMDNASVMKENPKILKTVDEMAYSEKKLFDNSLGWATTNDKGAPVIVNKRIGFGGDKVVGHEGNHAFLFRFSQPKSMLELLERALPARETKIIKGKETKLSGNDKKRMGSAHLNLERGSTLLDTRAFIIREQYQKTGKYPSFIELNQVIDNLPESRLVEIVRGTSAYGKEYAPLINDFNSLREALKYGYKKGGKLCLIPRK